MQINSKILKIKSKSKIKPTENIMGPAKHWRIILYTLSILVIVSFALGFYLFIEQDREINSISTEDAASPLNNVNMKHIQKVLDIFSEREKKSAEILSAQAPVTDPSI